MFILLLSLVFVVSLLLAFFVQRKDYIVIPAGFVAAISGAVLFIFLVIGPCQYNKYVKVKAQAEKARAYYQAVNKKENHFVLNEALKYKGAEAGAEYTRKLDILRSWNNTFILDWAIPDNINKFPKYIR